MQSASAQTLVIIHTNDIHSHFEQMPKIAAAIDDCRANYAPDQTLVVDCGDHADRMRAETEGTNGLANIAVMNATGYELFVLGNNEGLTMTPEMLANMFGNHAQFTVLCSNLLDQAAGEHADWAVPYHIIHKGRLKIGLVGLTANFSDFYRLLGWSSLDPVQTAANWVAFLRPQVDLVIVLSHLGLAMDKRLAEQIQGIDCILGAHTHHLLDPPLQIGGTVVCATGCFGQNIGKIELEYDFKQKKVTRATGACIPVANYPDKPEIVRLIAQFAREGQKQLDRVVAVLDEALPNDWEKESPLGNLLAAGLRSYTGADIGIVNAGQLLNGLDAGVVTAGMLLEICPSPINPCLMHIQGSHLKLALEESLLSEFTQKPIRGFGFRGRTLGVLCLDGLEVHYNESLPAYEKITAMHINEAPFDPSAKYSIGTIDMFTFGIGYVSLSSGSDIRYFLPDFIRDLLGQKLQDKHFIRASGRRHWFAQV